MSLPDTAWRRSLQPGMFRDAPFETERHRLTGGRRVAVHEYPLNDVTETEDLGRKADRFSITAYVIGPDYHLARERLESALAQPGPAALVHPYRGTLQVVVLEYSLSDSTREGGMASFEIQLIEHVPVSRPQFGSNTQASVRKSAIAATDTLKTQFVGRLAINNDAERAAAIGTFAELLGKVVQLPIDVTAIADRGERALRNALLDPVVDARAAIDGVVDLPTDLAAQTTSLISRIQSLSNLRGLFDIRLASRRTSGNDAANNSAAIDLVQGAAIIQAAGNVADGSFDSVDSAVAVRDELLDAIDSLQAGADDALFAALQDLRSDLVTDINTRSADLRRVTRFTPIETVPAVVIANQLYGPDRLEQNEADLVARNGIVHPLFVAGRQPLEVLSV